MAVGLDQDSEYLRRTGIPSGGAGTLSDGGFANNGIGVWVYRPSGTTTYALTAAGSIIHCQAGAREVVLGFNSAGAALADLNLQIIFDSGGGAGTPATFAGHLGNSFLDEWVFYFIYEASGTQHAGYIRLAAPTTVVKLSRANSNAGSQYVNDLTFGNESGGGAVAMGHYAYARARYASGLTDADMIAWAAATGPLGPDWAAWALPNASTLTDGTGNGRTLTGSGGLSSETDPTLGGGSTTADSALRDAGDTVASAAAVAVAAASAARDRPDVAAGSMSSPVSAAASLRDQADRVQAAVVTPGANASAVLLDRPDAVTSTQAAAVAMASALPDQVDRIAASLAAAVAGSAALLDGKDRVQADGGGASGMAAALVDGAAVVAGSLAAAVAAAVALLDQAAGVSGLAAVMVSVTGALRDLADQAAGTGGATSTIGTTAIVDGLDGASAESAIVVAMDGSLQDRVQRLVAVIGALVPPVASYTVVVGAGHAPVVIRLAETSFVIRLGR